MKRNETLGLKSHLNQRAFEHAKVQIAKKKTSKHRERERERGMRIDTKV